MAKAKQPLEYWEKEADTLLLDIRRNFIKLGEIMFFAHQDLTAEEYANFMKHIRQWGLRDADMKAARAAFLDGHPDLGNSEDERIDPRLLFAGAKNSKILFMDKQDQERLLSGEKFETVMSNGKADKPKTWAELSDVQRNMLIGKGGKILSVAEQQAFMTGTKNAAIHPLGSLELKKQNVLVSSRDGLMHLQCSLTEFARMILNDDESFWELLSRAVKDVRQESSGKFTPVACR